MNDIEALIADLARMSCMTTQTPSTCRIIDRAIAALRQQQGQGEPVAYRFTENRGNGKTDFSYYTPEELATAYRDNCLAITPLFTRPPAVRELSDEEILAIIEANPFVTRAGVCNTVRAVLAAAKEK